MPPLPTIPAWPPTPPLPPLPPLPYSSPPLPPWHWSFAAQLTAVKLKPLPINRPASGWDSVPSEMKSETMGPGLEPTVLPVGVACERETCFAAGRVDIVDAAAARRGFTESQISALVSERVTSGPAARRVVADRPGAAGREECGVLSEAPGSAEVAGRVP